MQLGDKNVKAAIINTFTVFTKVKNTWAWWEEKWKVFFRPKRHSRDENVISHISDLWNSINESRVPERKVEMLDIKCMWRNDTFKFSKIDGNYKNTDWRRTRPSHIKIKLLKTSGKKKILRRAREKRHIKYRKRKDSKLPIRNYVKQKIIKWHLYSNEKKNTLSIWNYTYNILQKWKRPSRQ